jgi:hypothetical protein
LSDTKTSPPRVVHEDAHCTAGTFQNVGIVIWRDDTEAASVRIVGQMLGRLSSQFPAGIGLMQLVGEGHPPLRAESRAELNRVLRSGATSIRCSTLVFEGQGFKAAAVRGIAAGLVMLKRVPFPHQVVNLQTAVDMQIAHIPPGAPRFDRAELNFAIEALRARLQGGRHKLERSA